MTFNSGERYFFQGYLISVELTMQHILLNIYIFENTTNNAMETSFVRGVGEGASALKKI